MRKLVSPGRLVVVALLMAALVVVYIAKLYQLQIVDGEAAYEASTNSIVSYEPVAAARGSLLDRYGRLLVSNRNCNNLIIDDVALFEVEVTPEQEAQGYTVYDKANANILSMCQIMTACGDTYNDELPISMTAPFEYEENIGQIEQMMLDAWKEANGLSPDASAVEVMARMRTRYDIDNNYSAEEMRIIAGVRYSVNVRYIINTSDYVFAQDVSIETITAMMESGIPGFDVQVSYIREYNTQFAAHILGYTRAMSAEQYEKYKELGYSYNAVVGQDGAEYAFEEYLHGTDGTAAVTRTSTGVITSTVYIDEEGETSAPIPGNHVYLTIDIELQALAEQILANFIEETNAEREERNIVKEAYGEDLTELITGGAIAVVDCRTGEPLCLANYPTFNPETMMEDYAELLKDSRGPLTNRCLMGRYSPGSTFKLCTAISGILENKISLDTEIDCTGRFTEYEVAGYAPYCWNRWGHSNMDLVDAITNSCNVYFFTVGDRVGQEKLTGYANRLGMGMPTGIELPENRGFVANPEIKAEIYAGTQDSEWYSGDTLQLAIGQSVTLVTPLQIARYAAAVANRGTVYNCSILKSVSSYDYSESIYQRQPDVFDEIELSDYIWDDIHEGMYGVTHVVGATGYEAFWDFYPAAAGKTGTTQGTGTDDGLFICFAPYDDPEIAVAVVLENAGAGANVAGLARQVLEYYFYFQESTAQMETEMTLLP